jgi:hypothetical protein
VPFSRLSTGALNVLVFALLTYIADLRGPGSVIFAMEEPEIAMPHPSGGWAYFVSKTMGQAIVTSHSPYVIERFTPEEIVVLNRDDTGRRRTPRCSMVGTAAVRGSDAAPDKSLAGKPTFPGVTVAATRRGLTGESSWINLDQSRFTRNTHELPCFLLISVPIGVIMSITDQWVVFLPESWSVPCARQEPSR